MKNSRILLASLLLLSSAMAHAESPTKDAQVLPSGVQISMIEGATGSQFATASDQVRVHYRGTLADGTEFDSSYKRGQPATFGLNQVIPCWTQGIQKIPVGAKAVLKCPAATAYGEAGIPGVIPPKSALTFQVELLEVVKK